jgi:hypothetical protein
MYSIIQDIIPNLPTVPFRLGYYEGIVFHCTDNPNHSGGDTPTGERNYETKTFESAFVHFFTGVEDMQPKIIQLAQTTGGAYGAGKTANHRFLHLELCMYDDANLFKMAYDAQVWLCAKLLHDRKLGVTDKGTVWNHKEVSDMWHESTHQDPIEYLKAHNIEWSQVIQDIQKQYDAMDNYNPFLQTVKVLCETDIRADHDHTSQYIKNAHMGEIYNVIERYGDWHRVILDNLGNSGWIDGNNGTNLYWLR